MHRAAESLSLRTLGFRYDIFQRTLALRLERLSGEFDLELTQDMRNAQTHIGKRPFNPKSLKGAPFPEGYVEQDLYIQVHMVIRVSGDDREPRHFCAVLEYAGRGADVERDDSGVPCPFLEVVATSDVGTSGEVQLPVLVPVGKFSEAGEVMRVGVFRSLVVRLQRLEECDIAGVHAVGLAAPTVVRSFPLLGGGVGVTVEGVFGEDRKLSFARDGLFSISLDELPSQVVQTRPCVVDNVPDDRAPLVRWPLVDLDLHSVLVGLKLEIVDDFIGLAPQEFLNGVLESVEVVVSPPHL